MGRCANHREIAAAAVCTKCGSSLCDPCSAFLINSAVWCEPCGNGEIDSGKGRPVLALVVFIVLFAVFVGLMVVQLFVINRFYFYSMAAILVPFGAAWPIAYPPTTGDRPIIVDRRDKRVALPASARAG